MSKGKLKKHPYHPKKRPVQPEEKIDGGVAGLAWYTPESYARLLEVSVDRQQRAATYEEWFENATDALINLQLMGVPFEKVLLDIDDIDAFVRWCHQEGCAIDRQACSSYISVLLSSGKATIIP